MIPPLIAVAMLFSLSWCAWRWQIWFGHCKPLGLRWNWRVVFRSNWYINWHVRQEVKRVLRSLR